MMGPLVSLSRCLINSDIIDGVEYCEASDVHDALQDLKALALKFGLYSDSLEQNDKQEIVS
jgi:hypothetical protein